MGVLHIPEKLGGSGDSIYQIRAIPLGRMGKPADISALVLFLVSDEASFITGQTIVSDGGYTIL